jgi:hypothetical protein
MQQDIVYQRFVKRWQEVTRVPPQTLGPLTPAYKAVTSRLKVMPWPVLVVVSIAAMVGLYFLIGSAVVFLTTLLQRGF